MVGMRIVGRFIRERTGAFALVYLALAADVVLGTPALAQMQGSSPVTVGYPTGNSTALNPYSINIYYVKPDGSVTFTKVTVPNVVKTAGLPTPTKAQVEKASADKTALIIAAINAQQIPIKPVTINGTTYNTLTAIPNFNTTPGMYATGATMIQNGMKVAVMAPADFSGYTVLGVTPKVINVDPLKLGDAVYRTAGNTVTGENGNGKAPFIPATGGSSGGGTGMAQATFGGLGATTGLSTGLDASANCPSLSLDASGDCPSLVGFGFIDETSSTPVDYIAAFYPAAGLNDGQILSDLAVLFNEDYASDGFTASYNSATDTLSIDQLLPLVDVTWSADSDTGLFLDDSMNTSPVPEPDSLLLFGTGLLGLGLLAGVKRHREKRLTIGD